MYDNWHEQPDAPRRPRRQLSPSSPATSEYTAKVSTWCLLYSTFDWHNLQTMSSALQYRVPTDIWYGDTFITNPNPRIFFTNPPESVLLQDFEIRNNIINYHAMLFQQNVCFRHHQTLPMHGLQKVPSGRHQVVMLDKQQSHKLPCQSSPACILKCTRHNAQHRQTQHWYLTES